MYIDVIIEVHGITIIKLLLIILHLGGKKWNYSVTIIQPYISQHSHTFRKWDQI